MHPDAIAGNSQNAKQRFWSGKVVVAADGTGAWNGDDAKSGPGGQPELQPAGVQADVGARATPTVELQPGAGMFAYLNKKLTDGPDQGAAWRSPTTSPRRTAPRSGSSSTSATPATTTR